MTIDHVNPEAPWPEIERLAEATRSRGLELAPRLPVYPEYVAELERWGDPAVAPYVRRAADAVGLARDDSWAPGEPGASRSSSAVTRRPLELTGDELGEDELTRLLEARGREMQRVLRRGRPAAAGGLRRRGDVRRHPEHPVHERLLLPLRLLRFLEGQARARTCAARRTSSRSRRSSVAREEAWERGATEVCLQGGIHPAFTGDYYADVVRAIKAAVPEHPRPRVLGARGLAGGGDARARARASTSRTCATSGSARCPEPPPRCSTTRCAGSSAPTR